MDKVAAGEGEADDVGGVWWSLPDAADADHEPSVAEAAAIEASLVNAPASTGALNLPFRSTEVRVHLCAVLMPNSRPSCGAWLICDRASCTGAANKALGRQSRVHSAQ